jgi:hypothetical protein
MGDAFTALFLFSLVLLCVAAVALLPLAVNFHNARIALKRLHEDYAQLASLLATIESDKAALEARFDALHAQFLALQAQVTLLQRRSQTQGTPKRIAGASPSHTQLDPLREDSISPISESSASQMEVSPADALSAAVKIGQHEENTN